MAINLLKEINDSKLGLWCLNEDFDELYNKFTDIANKEDIIKVNKFKFEKRKQEWIATRLLVAEICGKYKTIKYDKYGKPSIEGANISISHTKGLVAVVIGNKDVGIDVEKVSERIIKIAPRFLYPTEISEIDINNQLLQFHAYWCAKETIYKIYSKKAVDFKNNIKIKPFQIKNEGKIIGKINIDNFKEEYKLNYFIHKENNVAETYIVVYYL